MSNNASGGAIRAAVCAMALALMAGAVARPAAASANFPDVPVWAFPGAWQDSSMIRDANGVLIFRNRCVGSFMGPLPDSIREQPRSVTLRFLRDRRTELRPDFGGYRIYRMTSTPDSSKALLLRRFSLNSGSDLTWNFSRVTRSSGVSVFPGIGTGSLGARRDVASGVLPRAINITDVNLDGRKDLIVANEGSNSISFFSGASNLAARTDLPTLGRPSSLSLGTWSPDASIDLLVGCPGGPGLSVFRGSAVGAYTASVDTVLTGGPENAAFVELNSDTLRDIVVTLRNEDSVMVILGRASGLFSHPVRDLDRKKFATGHLPGFFTSGDVNGDGRADVLVANEGDHTVTVFTGNGLGGLVPTGTLAIGNNAAAMALGDLDGDNDLDLVVTDSGTNAMSVYLGNGLGGFAAPTAFTTGAGPSGFALGDLNGDNRLDAVVANQSANSVSVFLGDGSGGFGARSDFGTDVGPRVVAIGDLDGDAIADVAVGNYSYRLPYVCNGVAVDDSVVTFVDSDSIGRFVKVCRRPGVVGQPCQTPGDSIFVLDAPPGPHDGFQTWYSVTIERRNTTDPDYEDLFVPDTLGVIGPCGNPSDPKTCPNLNHKLRNLVTPVEPTTGPTANLERVLVVPNPYRGSEVWDKPGQGEIHFINLPSRAKIRIYTAAGDLVREIEHADNVRDFEIWDLRNASGRSVASGIYMYRIEAGSFHFQNRFVVIR